LITSNIIQRVLHLKVIDVVCSAFTIEVEQQQYLITAKHCFEHVNFPDRFTVQIFKNSEWQNLNVKIYYHQTNNIDIAVMFFGKGKYITPTPEIKYGMNDVYLSQDCYFLGFPYGRFSPDKGINNGYPIPLIKKACISAVDFRDEITNVYLDGSINGGFSGGPSVITHADGSIQIFGIACASIVDFEAVKHTDDIEMFVGVSSDKEYAIYEENPRIIQTYGFNHVIEIINKME